MVADKLALVEPHFGAGRAPAIRTASASRDIWDWKHSCHSSEQRRVVLRVVEQRVESSPRRDALDARASPKKPGASATRQRTHQWVEVRVRFSVPIGTEKRI